MENQRLFLWSMLAIVSFFMMQAWQKDYAPKPPVETVQELAAVSNSAPADLNVPGIETSSTDIPEVQTAATVATAPAKLGELIKVTTVVYAIELSTQGASLVGLSLPHMPKDKKNPDVPVILFAQNDSETYVLNSGLRASGVAVEPTHQELWKSAASNYTLGDKDSLQVPFYLDFT